MKLTSDRIQIADANGMGQILDEYVFDTMLELTNKNGTVNLYGDCIFAVQHKSNVDENVIGAEVEEQSIADFLTDLSRVAEPESLPIRITEICQGSLDQHPGRTKYVVDESTVRITYDHGKTVRFDTEQHGILTSPDK